MEYRTLTGTGATVSRVCLGTMTFGSQVDEADSIRMVHRALDAGVNFIDTADVYNQGLSETITGKALKGKRDEVVLASKVGNPVGPHELKDLGLTRWHIIHGVEASLKRLQTECLDIYYLHRPDYNTPLEESLAAFDQLVRQGKVMYVGISNYASWQICHALSLCDQNRFPPPVVTQVPYNLLTRGIEQELLPLCREFGIGVTVYNPLAAGLLTGKHDFTGPPTQGTRFQLDPQYFDRYWTDSHFEGATKLMEIAEQAGVKPTALAFQWLAGQEIVDAILVGASRMEHLEENLFAWQGTLDEDTLEACDRVWERIRGDSFRYNR
jgi:aryl-alcohol dehydrogenase-like predicted oxidoreductase